jgi:hypothetical protein
MRGFALVALTGSVFCLAPAVRADDLDKKVVDIVKQVGVLYKDAKSLHVQGTIVTNAGEGDAKKQIRMAATIDLEKPNRFALRAANQDDKSAGLTVVSDGKTVFVHPKRSKQYTESPAPSGLSDVAMTLQRYGHANTGLLFQNVLGDDPADQLMDGVTACSYAGKETVGGVAVHHLKFTQPDFEWELWVAAEGKPFVMKAAVKRSTDNGDINTVETYENWKIDTAPEKDAFAFSAPADAKKVDEIEQDR